LGKILLVAACSVVATLLILTTLLAWTTFVGPPITLNTNIVAKTPEGEIVDVTPEMRYFYEAGGQLTLTIDMYWTYDDSAISSARPLVKIYHANKQSLMASYGTTDNSTSGDLWISDAGKLYMVIDHSTGTTYFLDEAATLARGGDYLTGKVLPTSYITSGDYDNDGTIEYYYELNFKTLAKTDNQQQSAHLSVYLTKVESAPSIVSSLNVTGVSTSAYNYYSAEAYISGWDGEGYAVKIAKVQLTLPDSANATYVEDGNIRLQELRVADNVYTGYDWDYSSRVFKMDMGTTSTQETQESYGTLVYYNRGAGSTFAKINLKIYAKFPAAAVIDFTVKIYYINPAGTIASATHEMTFTAT